MEHFPKFTPPQEESPLNKAFDPELLKSEIERASSMIEEGEQILEKAEKLASTPELKKSIARVQKSRSNLLHAVALAVSMFSAGSSATMLGQSLREANEHSSMVEDAHQTRELLESAHQEDIHAISEQLREWRSQPGNESRPYVAMSRHLVEVYRDEHPHEDFFRDGNDPRGNPDMPLIQLQSLVLEDATSDRGTESQ